MLQVIVNKKYKYLTGFLFTDEISRDTGDVKPVFSWALVDELEEKHEINPADFDPIKLSDMIEHPVNYVYVDGEIKTRPYIKIEQYGFPNDKQEDTDTFLKINQKVTMRVKLYNPDNVPGYELEDIKLKDRNSFLDMDSQVVKLSDGTFEFEVESAFPGIAILRAKDLEIAAKFYVNTIRFRQ